MKSLPIQTKSVPTNKNEVIVTPTAPPTVTQSPTGHYVNLGRIITDHSPLVLEYLDNEISNLVRKIEVLKKERDLVSKLYQVIKEEAPSTK